MKVDETKLQNILKAYGNKMKPDKTKAKSQKHDITNKNTPNTKTNTKLVSEDLDTINYNKEGNISINPQKKDALIDFFQ